MSKLTKSEKVLICTGLFMLAITVGYNAFFVPKIDTKMQLMSDVSEDNFTEETLENIETSEEKININEASVSELMKINGIGNYLAENIVEYREKHGGFADISEIVNVKGIGEKLFKRIENQICV